MHGTRLRCDACPVRDRTICSALEYNALVMLEKISKRRTFGPNEIIFHDGDQSNKYFNIMSGAIKLIKTLADGKQHIVGLLYPPDFMGQPINTHHTYSAETATASELCSYARGPFDIFLKTHPQLERKIFEMTLRELDACRDWSLLLGRKCAHERVSGFLLMAAKRIPKMSDSADDRNSAHFQLPFTRAEMADYLGLTLETVSRQFSSLKKKRIIVLRSSREIIIPDMALLSAIANIETCSTLIPLQKRQAVVNERALQQRFAPSADASRSLSE